MPRKFEVSSAQSFKARLLNIMPRQNKKTQREDPSSPPGKSRKIAQADDKYSPKSNGSSPFHEDGESEFGPALTETRLKYIVYMPKYSL